MPIITIKPDGTIYAAKDTAEMAQYYDAEIEKRIQAMLKIQALGGNVTAIQKKIQQLNTEKKQKMAGGS